MQTASNNAVLLWCDSHC